MLLKVTLQIARDDYEDRRKRQGIEIARSEGRYKGRRPDTEKNQKIIELRLRGVSISQTARFLGCSAAQVKRVWAGYKKPNKPGVGS
ncbi:Helix-turn-helix domain of resolvase [Marinobacterium lutimaris]|uniref:Helix-turn-helix domain of resolvase n=1 Tax=Marinobacterium lutimaris TaxID=568106 RepID=A0A1H6DPW0_9GAMM|nr:Helix-turn-helix domain of resolvase [Marinobacterium lutimaris]